MLKIKYIIIFFILLFYIDIVSANTWTSNSTLVNGLSTIEYPSQEVYYNGTNWILISGNDLGTFIGYVWNGSGWQLDASTVVGLGTLGNYTTPTIYFKDDNYYLISSDNTGLFFGYVWTGSTWTPNTAISSGLYVPSGFKSAPEMYNNRNIKTNNFLYYLIHFRVGNNYECRNLYDTWTSNISYWNIISY